MKRTLGAIVVSMAITPVPAWAAQESQSQQTPARNEAAGAAAQGKRDAQAGAQTTPNSPAYSGRTLTVRGEIESVDRQMRTITIKDKEGRISMLRAAPEMRNFEDLAKGAKVVVRYSEAVLLSIGRSGVPPQAQTSTSAGTSTNGAPPQMQGVKHTQVTATITEIDPLAQSIRLAAPNGEELRMRVREKADMTGLQKGDEVTVSYIEAFALAVNDDDGSAAATK